MSIKCGNCKGSHESVDQVRSCYSGQLTPVSRTDVDSAAQSINRGISQTIARFATVDDVPEDVWPEKAPNPFDDSATEKQVNFIARLRKERGLDELKFSGTKKQASAEIGRLLEMPKADQPERGRAFPAVPAGHYAVDSLTGNNDLDFFRVDRPEDGRWAGRVFVHRIIGGHPDVQVRGRTQGEALRAILSAGITEAATRYGKELDRCVRCNRTLTDQASREHVPPMGPDCRTK